MQISSKEILQAVVCLNVVVVVSCLYMIRQANAQSDLPQLPTGPAEERQAFLAELSNIQAMAFGFSAICENGDLKLRSDRGATFVVSQSLLCELKAQSLQLEKRKLFTLCSNNPGYIERERLEGRLTERCSELRIGRIEI